MQRSEGGALAEEAMAMPEREQGFGRRALMAPPALPQGPGTEAWVAELRLTECASPAPSVLSPGWLRPRPQPGKRGRGGMQD